MQHQPFNPIYHNWQPRTSHHNPHKKQGKIFDVMASDEEELLSSSLATEVIKLKSSRDSIIEKCVTDLYCTSSDVSYFNYINSFPSTIKNAFKYIT